MPSIRDPLKLGFVHLKIDLKKIEKSAEITFQDTLAESFYNVKYGLSIITSKVKQKILVMKT